jgi:hypothetical protein
MNENGKAVQDVFMASAVLLIVVGILMYIGVIG